MKKNKILIFLLVVLFTVQTVQSWTMVQTTENNYTKYVFELNESELPFLYNITIPVGVTNVTNRTYNIQYGQFLYGNTTLYLNGTQTVNYTVHINIPNGTQPAIYKSNVSFFYNGTLIYAMLYNFILYQVPSEVFNVSEEFLNISKNYFYYLIYDVELPWIKNYPISIAAPVGETITFSCEGFLICEPKSFEVTQKYVDYNLRIEINSGVPLGNYTNQLRINTENRSGNVTFDFEIKKAPVQIINITQELPFNKTLQDLSYEEWLEL